MLKTLKHILQANEFMRLPKEMRRVVFYSEGKSYWPLFKGLIDGIIERSGLNVCYITSGKDDPGFEYIDNHFKSFLIDDSYVRNWLFKNMQADVLIMTMPDLNQYQVKRSKYPVHYIYVQHALMSLHMAYRQGAFDWFDTVFCSGPHHVHEIRCLEEKYNLPQKKLLEHGYARLDSIIKHKKATKVDNMFKHALFAPSWGNNAAIELGLGDQVVEKLLSFGYKVTLRPHPETLKSSSKIINKIISKHGNNKMFTYDQCVSSLDSFYQSDFMISDWSGAALEYSFGLNKPVIFLDLPKKINNPKYKEIDAVPLEVSVREDIGVIVSVDNLSPSLISSLFYGKVDSSKYVFNIGKSDFYGVKYILDMMNDLRNKKSL
jgi:CDP-glycerol glycerophosphotransferase (TagB/SpsB family)